MHLQKQLLETTKYYNVPDAGGGAPAPTPAPSPAPTPEPTPSPTPEPTPTPAPAPTPTPAPVEDWKDKRIKELTAKLNAERSKVATPTPTPTPGETPEAIQARIDEESNRKAAEIAAVTDWNSRCNAVNEQGAKEFKDFGDRLKVCQSVVNLADPAEFAQFNSFIAAAMETGEAHKLIHELGGDAAEVKRLVSLPPLKMAMEMAKRAVKLGAAPPAEDPSGAPRPIDPIGSRGNHYDGLDVRTPNGAKLPIGEWMKQREKQAAEVGIQ